MYRNILLFPVVLSVLVAFNLTYASNVAHVVQFDEHNIILTLNIPEHSATVIDSGSMELKSGWNLFQLNHQASIHTFTLDGKEVAGRNLRVLKAHSTKKVKEDAENVK